MKKYYENFSFVELNRTFYEYPRMPTVVGWREKAPPEFEFSVKAHQDISHKFRFELEPSLQAFEKMKQICQTLSARTLLIQTPSSFRPDKLSDAEKFLSKIKPYDLQLVWETRGTMWDSPDIRGKLAGTLRKLGVAHVTDPFRVSPAYTEKVAYFRLHGLGKELYYYQHTDNELKQLLGLVEPFEHNGKEVYVLFNNLAMFDDAVRFKSYMETGVFPSLTGAVGINSVQKVIEKTRYPLTKSMLSKRLGWRLVELEKGKQTKLDELLKRLPLCKSYENVDEVLHELMRCI
jgi:uncharacterized protein YecE (DUF72 family)